MTRGAPKMLTCQRKRHQQEMADLPSSILRFCQIDLANLPYGKLLAARLKISCAWAGYVSQSKNFHEGKYPFTTRK
jgi:hypothetical protein